MGTAQRVKRLALRRMRRYPNLPHIIGACDALKLMEPSDSVPTLSIDQYAVYVILDESDAVIYVGCTSRPTTRISHHRRTGRLNDNGHVVWLTANGRSRALDCEQFLIAVLNPQDNKQCAQLQWPGEGRGLTLDELESLSQRRLSITEMLVAAERGAA